MQYSTVLYGTVLYSTRTSPDSRLPAKKKSPHSWQEPYANCGPDILTVLYCTILYTVQYSTVLYSTVQYSCTTETQAQVPSTLLKLTPAHAKPPELPELPPTRALLLYQKKAHIPGKNHMLTAVRIC